MLRGRRRGRPHPAPPLLAPVSPPPDIDVEAWERTLDAIEERRPGATPALPHFGVAEDPELHLAELRSALRTWAERARRGSEEEFVARGRGGRARGGRSPRLPQLFQQAGPFWQSYAGLRRYWDKKEGDCSRVIGYGVT